MVENKDFILKGIVFVIHKFTDLYFLFFIINEIINIYYNFESILNRR